VEAGRLVPCGSDVTQPASSEAGKKIAMNGPRARADQKEQFSTRLSNSYPDSFTIKAPDHAERMVNKSLKPISARRRPHCSHPGGASGRKALLQFRRCERTHFYSGKYILINGIAVSEWGPKEGWSCLPPMSK
jgi:hypothetical protein